MITHITLHYIYSFELQSNYSVPYDKFSNSRLYTTGISWYILHKLWILQFRYARWNSLLKIYILVSKINHFWVIFLLWSESHFGHNSPHPPPTHTHLNTPPHHTIPHLHAIAKTLLRSPFCTSFIDDIRPLAPCDSTGSHPPRAAL